MIKLSNKITIYGYKKNVFQKLCVLKNKFVYKGLQWWGDLIKSYYNSDTDYSSHNPPNKMFLSPNRIPVEINESFDTSDILYCRTFYVDVSYPAEEYVSGYYKRKCVFWANFPMETNRNIYYSIGLAYDDTVEINEYSRVVFDGVGKTEFVGFIVKYELFVAEKEVNSNCKLGKEFIDAIVEAIKNGYVDFKTLSFRRSSDSSLFSRSLDGRQVGILNASSQAQRNYVVNTFWARVDLAEDEAGNVMSWNDTFDNVSGNNFYTHSITPAERVDKKCWFVKIVTEIC